MPLLINRELVSDDSWQLVDEETLQQGGDIIVPLALYLENRDALLQREGRLAVQFNGDDDFDAVLQDKDQFALIAIDFPAFGDGRGFSLARILRREGFAGQLRAVGSVTRDRFQYFERVGFDALQVADDRFDEACLASFDDLNVQYQGSTDNPKPIYHQ